MKAARARGISVSLQSDVSDLTMPTEINVIGRTVDEATSEVEKFVDRAFLAGMPKVRIVHGSGMGILRKALRQYLQKHPHIGITSNLHKRAFQHKFHKIEGFTDKHQVERLLYWNRSMKFTEPSPAKSN